MEDQELQHLWKRSTPEASVQIDSSQLSAGLENNLRSFNKKIRNRNLREMLAAVLVCLTFSVLTFLLPGTLTKIGSTLCALYGLMIIVIVNHLKGSTTDDYTLSLKDYLLSQKARLVTERKLTNTVLYWYILPPTIGALLFVAGMPLPYTAIILMAVIICFINATIYFLNKNVVRKTIDPLLLQLDTQINQLDTNE